MPSVTYFWERIKRLLLIFWGFVLAHKPLTFLSVLIVFPLTSFLVWVLIETTKLDNTGFNTKTLWDWMDLLLVPAALGVGIWWLNKSEKSSERSITTDRLRETALQSYFNTMTELLLEHDSSSPALEDNNNVKGKKIRSIARIRTLSILRGVGEQRKIQVLQFLYESDLIFFPPVVDLKHADLENAHLAYVFLEKAVINEVNLRDANLERAKMEGVKLFRADLRWAILKQANLSLADLRNANLANSDLRGIVLSDAVLREAYLVHADLREAVLRGADFRDATLSKADLRNANLEDADLRRANLEGARVSLEQLKKARKLDDAIMPDGNKYKASNPTA